MRFLTFLSALVAYVALQTILCRLAGLAWSTVFWLDLAAIVLAQCIYLVMIVAMVRAEKARRDRESQDAAPADTAPAPSIKGCDPARP